MPLRSDHNRIYGERLFLTETVEGRGRIDALLSRLAVGELMAMGSAALLACFAPAGLRWWLYLAAALYMAGLVLWDVGGSTVKTVLFVLPPAVAAFGAYAGLLRFANQVITVYNARFDAYVSLLAAPACSTLNALLFELAVLAVLLWLVYGGLRAKTPLPASLFCLAVFALIGMGGLGVAPLFCGLLALGWVLCWLQKTTAAGVTGKNVIFLCLLAAAFCAVVFSLAANSKSADAGMTALHDHAEEAVDTFRYGSDTLPQGDMTLAAAMGRGQGEALEVTFSGRPQELYLKGFVGGDFSGSGWAEPAGSLYHGDNSGIVEWLRQNGMVVPFQYASYYTYTDVGANAPRDTLQVKNTGAYRKYLYLPYQTLAVQGRSWAAAEDTGLYSAALFGARRYTAATVGASNFQQTILREDLNEDVPGAQAFGEAEQVYRIFAHENYLTVSEADRAAIRDALFEGKDWSGASLSAVTTQIRVMLQARAGYSTAPTRYTGAQDFVPWLLAGGSTGNSAYYATASVLAYRCAGIPARYAEGYYLSGTAAQKLSDAGSQTTALTAEAAHAWPEVYLDGIGWIPVETTPGFYYAEYSFSQVLGQPDSSVNIADQQTADQLQGSTADTLSQQEQDQPAPTDRRALGLHLLGALLLAAILLCAAYLALELQAALRQWVRRRKIKTAPPEQALRLMFTDIFRIFRARGTPAEESRPYAAAALIQSDYSGLEPEEYTHLVDVLGKTVFGEIPPEPGELVTAQRFLERLAETALHGAGRKRRLIMRYFYAYCG